MPCWSAFRSLVLGPPVGPRPQGGSSGPRSPGHPMVSWLSAMPILRFACGHWNPGKTKSHVILSVRSRDFQGTRVSTLLIPPSPPQRPRLSFQAAQHHFLNALGPLKIKEREVSCQQLLLSVQPEAKSEPGFLLTSK